MIDWIEFYKDILDITNAVPDFDTTLHRSIITLKKYFQLPINTVFLADDLGERLILKASDCAEIKEDNEVYLSCRISEDKPLALAGTFSIINNPEELENFFTYIPDELKRIKTLILKTQKIEEKRSVMILMGCNTALEKDDSFLKDLDTASTYIANKITTADIIRNAKHNLLKLQSLNEIGTVLNSETSLQNLLDLVVKTSVELIPSKGSVLRILNTQNNILEVKANYGADEVVKRFPSVKTGEFITGRVVESGTPLLINDIRNANIPTPLRDIPITSVLCVPLKAEDKVIGTLGLVDKYPVFKGKFSNFTENDMRLLSTLASQAAVAVEKTNTYHNMQKLAEDNQKKLRELTILHEISNAMRLTTNLTRRLYMVLTAVTIQDGLGFNRAFILMLNERTNVLQGMLGVGPDSAQDAGRIWNSMVARHFTLQEALTSADYLANLTQSQVNRIARSIRIDISKSNCILARTVKEKRPFNIAELVGDSTVNKEILEKMQTDNFASVPLLARDKVIGILLVDNIFNRKPITEDEIRFLSVFANQAGLAIETTRLYSYLEETNEELKKMQQRLIESEKLAALGEMAATVAHEIRNPLVSIGGFARRLKSIMSGAGDESAYLDIIIKEVQRLEKILKDILNFSRESSLEMTENNINDLLQDIIIMFSSEFKEKHIDIITEFDQDIPPFRFDILQMKQAIINVLSNSAQAINRNGAITIKTHFTPEEDIVVIEISDTGGGIPPQVLDNIFSPFFTTKNYGIGLGLAITKKIVENHRGNIDITNKVGEGIIFEINLPLNQNGKQVTLTQNQELNGGNRL
ncbi:MAG: GAF domain-containing protein [Candidatus Schekmanbacteria bacterium]|nr:GAF domain-containing protein [Candidatus Schekmanbacteria bacterium]